MSAIIQGTFIYNGRPQNGATAKLWQKAGFPTPPSQDDDEPDVGYQEGSTLTTSPTYGGDGAFRWTSVPAGEYYVSCYYDNHRAWFFYGEAHITSLLTTEGDILIRGTSAPERLAKGSLDQVLTMGASKPQWSTLSLTSTIIRKASDETVNNSNTLQDDDELYFAIAASEIWAFRMFLRFNSGTTPDIKFAITVPSGATLQWHYHRELTASTSHGTVTASGTSASADGTGNNDTFTIEGIVANGATPGNVQLQWAQETADASDTKVLANSFLEKFPLSV